LPRERGSPTSRRHAVGAGGGHAAGRGATRGQAVHSRGRPTRRRPAGWHAICQGYREALRLSTGPIQEGAHLHWEAAPLGEDHGAADHLGLQAQRVSIALHADDSLSTRTTHLRVGRLAVGLGGMGLQRVAEGLGPHLCAASLSLRTSRRHGGWPSRRRSADCTTTTIAPHELSSVWILGASVRLPSYLERASLAGPWAEVAGLLPGAVLAGGEREAHEEAPLPCIRGRDWKSASKGQCQASQSRITHRHPCCTVGLL
jgi:hypothetical protein